MNNICTNNWKEFKIGGKNGLFEVTRPNARSAQTYSDGDMPYIASGCFNNGVCGYFEQKDKNDFDKGNCITVSPVDGYAFYQKDDFLGRGGAGSSIIILRRDNLNEYVGKFICTIIRKACKEWTYSNMGNKDKLKDTIIKLPVNKNNEPDWKYMESYMKNIMQESEKNIENLQNISRSKNEINIEEWQEYRLGDLFYKCNLNKKNDFNKNSDVSLEKTKEFDLPLVNAKHYNNGIMYYGRSSDFDSEIMTLDIVQNGAVAVGDVYAQPQRTGVLEDAYLIKPYEVITSEEILQFLATVIQKDIKQHFSYDDKCTWDKAKEMKIHLPSKIDGKPDWEYMENYMKNIMEDTQSKLDKLVCC